MKLDIEILKRDYEENGIVVLEGLLDPSLLAEVRENLATYQTDIVPALPSKDFTLEPDDQTVRNLWRMEIHSEFFSSLAHREEYVPLLRILLNGEPELWAVETFNKPAEVGSAVPYHQDNAYFCKTPPDILTVWIAVDDVTEENGPVTYLLGSHRQQFPHTPSGVRGNSFGLAVPPAKGDFKEYRALIKAGDAIIHHSQTVHRSDPNQSGLPRCALLMVFGGTHVNVDPKMKEVYEAAVAQTPPDAGRES